MKRGLLFAALLAASLSYGQCIKCESYEEALKEPSKVISIKVNPYLGDETFEEFPEDITEFTNLEELFLTDHGFTTLPPEIAQLKKLKKLSLAGNGLEELPDELFEMKHLKELILYSNEFSEEYLEEIKSKAKEKLPNTKVMTD